MTYNYYRNQYSCFAAFISILLFLNQVRKRLERHTYIREIEVNGFLNNLLLLK